MYISNGLAVIDLFQFLYMPLSSLVQWILSVGSEMKTSTATKPTVLTKHQFFSHICSSVSSHSLTVTPLNLYVRQADVTLFGCSAVAYM